MPKQSQYKRTNKAKPKTPIARAGKPQIVKGLKDVVSIDDHFWLYLSDLFFKTAHLYNFNYVDAPFLENANLFTLAGAKKASCGINLRGIPETSLRCDLRPGLLRLFYDHHLYEQPKPYKMFSFGDVYELGKGPSLNSKKQVVFQYVGEVEAVCEAQLVLICHRICTSLSLPINIQINNVGCHDCREQYAKELTGYFRSHRTKLCESCRKLVTKNPVEIIRCSEKSCQEVVEEAPQTLDWLCEKCKEEFIKVLEYLDELEIAYNLNPHLVGQEISESTIFEIWTEEGSVKKEEKTDPPVDLRSNRGKDDKKEKVEEEVQDVEIKPALIAYGGRSKNFLSKYYEEEAQVSGIVFHIEKMISQCRKREVKGLEIFKADIFVAQLGEAARRRAMVLFEELHGKGFGVAEAFCHSSLKTQLDLANRLGVKYVLIVGQKEVIDGTVMMRDMDGGIQEVVANKKIEEELKKKLPE